MTIANAKPDLLITGPIGTSMVNAASSAWHDYLTVEAKITAAIAYAVSIGAKYCYVPDSFLPYTASLVTFNPAVKMLRENGLSGGGYDVMAYGADNTGAVACDASLNGIYAAGVAKGGCDVLFDAGTFTATATAPTAGTRFRLLGQGRGLTILRHPSGGQVINWTQSYLRAEYFSEIADMTIRGNGASASPWVAISNAALFHMRRVHIDNNASLVAATALQLTSLFDSEFHDVYVADCGSGSTSPCVVLTVDGVANHTLNNCQFINFHVEPGSVDAILFDMVGNATNLVVDNRFYGLKTHGDPTTGYPLTQPVVRMNQYTSDNTFYGHLIAFGKGTAQLVCDGVRNSWVSPVFGVAAGLAPTYGIQFTANATGNRLATPNFKTSAQYGTACIRTDAGALGTQVIFPMYSSGTILSDAGSRTVVFHEDANVNTGFNLHAADGLYLNQFAAWDRHIDLTWGAAVAISNFLSRKFFLAALTNIAATISAPGGPPSAGQAQRISITILNSTGGALTTGVAFNAVFKTSGGVQPANGTRITVDFDYDQANAVWVEASRSAAV